MPLPTTNLTAHFTFDDGSRLWQATQVGTPYRNTAAVDGNAVVTADSVEAGIDVRITRNNGPRWRSGTPLMLLPCVEFIASNSDEYTFSSNDYTVAKTATDYIATTAHTSLCSIYVTDVNTNDASPWLNNAIWADRGAQVGLHARTSGGIDYLQAYCYSGAATVAEIPFLRNTSYVVRTRHGSNNIHISLNGGTEVSSASGAWAGGSAAFILGSGFASQYHDFRMGEVAFYNVDLGATHGAETTWFTGRWLTAPSGGFIPIIGRGPGLALVGSGGLAA